MRARRRRALGVVVAMPTGDVLRKGIALLEVLVATLLLGTAGLALTSHAVQSAYAVALIEAREVDIRHASSLLARLSVARHGELRSRLGLARVDGFLVRVDLVVPGVFGVTVSDSSTGATLLQTRVYPNDGRINDAP